MEYKNRTIDIFGTKWYIKYVPKVFSIDEDNPDILVWGDCDHSTRTIRVALTNLKGDKIPNEDIKNTLLHELMHCIFGSGAYNNVNDDEPLVEWCAKCIRSLLKQKVL